MLRSLSKGALSTRIKKDKKNKKRWDEGGEDRNDGRRSSEHFHEDPDEDNGNAMRFSIAVIDADGMDSNEEEDYVEEENTNVDGNKSESSDGEKDDLHLDTVNEEDEEDEDEEKKDTRKIKYEKSSKSSSASSKSKGAGGGGKATTRSDDSVGSGSAKSKKSTKSSKSTKSKKVKLKKEPSSASVKSSVSTKSSSSKKKKKSKKEKESTKKDEVLQLSPRSQSSPRSPNKSHSKSPKRKKTTTTTATMATNSSPGVHPIKRELERFSTIWGTGPSTPTNNNGGGHQAQDSIGGGGLASVLLSEIKRGDKNEDIGEKAARLERELQESLEQVDSLTIEQRNMRQELEDEQQRNDELSQQLLQLEELMEQQQQQQQNEGAKRQDGDDNDSVEAFDLEQEIKHLKAEMEMQQERHRQALEEKNEIIAKLESNGNNSINESNSKDDDDERDMTLAGGGGDGKTQGLLLRANDKIQKQETEIKELKMRIEEMANGNIVEGKNKEIKALTDQTKTLQKEIAQMKSEHEKVLKQKEETIAFFQEQLVDLQKRVPKPAAYTSSSSLVMEGEEGTMALGGEKGDRNGASAGEGSGFFGLLSRSPGWLSGRKVMEDEKTKDVPDVPAL